MGVARGGVELRVSEQDLDVTDIFTALEQMGCERMAAGIVTLLMILGLPRSVTGIIRSSGRAWTSFGGCDVSTKNSSS